VDYAPLSLARKHYFDMTYSTSAPPNAAFGRRAAYGI
jgi:hypothetical protein